MDNSVSRSPLAGPLGALTLTGGLVVLDQVTKIAATQALRGVGAPLRNPDYAFGIIGGSPIVLALVAIAVLAGFVAVMVPLAARFQISAGIPALIAGGLLGNTLDRIRLGSVRDFIVVPGAIINVADVCVFAGLVGLVIALVMHALSLDRASESARS